VDIFGGRLFERDGQRVFFSDGFFGGRLIPPAPELRDDRGEDRGEDLGEGVESESGPADSGFFPGEV